jgi:hypothetical protein
VPLIRPYCPPYHPTMAAAVRAVADRKFGPQGIFRGGALHSAWREPESIAASAAPSEVAVAATIAYGEYVYRRYGRFPAAGGPFRVALAYQAHHVDETFYDRFYRPEALSPAGPTARS